MTAPMALVDFIPVALFLTAAVMLQRDLYGKMSKGSFALFAGGAFMVVTAGVFKAVLFPTLAPQACDNFIGLVQQGYYNGLTVSRVENQFVVEAGQGADGKGSTIWKGNRYPVEASDSLHHYAGALCMGVDASGACASVFYVVESLPGEQSVTQELVDQMNAAGYRAEVVSAYQTAGGAPYLDYTDTVFGQVYEGMDIVDTIAQTAVDESQKPTTDITINSVSIETYQG